MNWFGTIVHAQFPFGGHYGLALDADENNWKLFVISSKSHLSERDDCLAISPTDYLVPFKKDSFVKIGDVHKVSGEDIDKIYPESLPMEFLEEIERKIKEVRE